MPDPSIPGYSIVEKLGSGGFATVYRALHADDGSEWAIKVLHDHATEGDDLRRFERERTTMQALSGQDNIVSVQDHGQTVEGLHYTVLEYVGGGSVRDRLKSGGAVHWAEAVSIGAQICAALDLAHRNGVLHRDVKPANILLDEGTAKLTDFGIARLVGQSAMTAAQSIIGTLAYTPPELFENGPFDGRGDIYQLGVTLYEMLLGRAPFTSSSAESKAMIIRRILEKPAPPLAQFDIPQPLSDLLDEVLAKDPADRPQTADRLRQRLNDVEVQLGRNPTTVTMFQEGEAANQETVTFGADITTGASHSTIWDNEPQQAAAAPESESRFGKEPLSDPPVVSLAAASDVPIASDVPVVPDISLPDANQTVVEPRPSNTTILGSSTAGVIPPVSIQREQPAAAPVSAHAPQVDTPQTTNEGSFEQGQPSRGNRWWWIAAAGVIVLAIGGGLLGRELATDNSNANEPAVETVDDDSGDSDVSDDPEENEGDPPAPSAFSTFAEAAFANPAGDQGVAFGSVANRFGLTVVGAAGDGDDIGSQRAQMWTVGPEAGELVSQHRMNFPSDADADTDTQRLWDIGVIDSEAFLVVGDEVGSGGTDGIAWFGSRAGGTDESGDFVAVSDASFSGSGTDSLRSVVADGDDRFLVAGQRTEGTTSVPAIWNVERNAGDWPAAQWTPVDVGGTGTGVLNDIAINGSTAVAVGFEDLEDGEAAIVKIRRGDDWEDLIAPLPDGRFWGVTITDDRIVIVGEVGANPAQRTPVAIVADLDGAGFVHDLPVRESSGIARDVIVTSTGAVVAVGDETDGDLRRGAVWELLTAEELLEDRWTTRLSTELQSQTEGFIELWSISEFDDQLFAFGRTESDDRRPAAAWMLDLS